ncbi:MAG: DUF1450 domain-containing protein [Geobacteraceae bacterium]|nr:DUF1450 domain-containing protein [Geobacteraceae bacterium]
MKIRFCENNKGAGKVLKKLKENHPAVDAKRKGCIKKCGPCKKELFAVIDGETVKAETGEKLYDKITEMIKK